MLDARIAVVVKPDRQETGLDTKRNPIRKGFEARNNRFANQ